MSGARGSRAVLACVVVLALAAAVEARQTPTPTRSAEETARSVAARWKPLLGLSDEQTARFEAVALEAEKKTAAARASSGGDPAKFRDAMKPVLEERNAAVVKILTPGQMQKYDAAMELARKKVAEKAPAAAPTKPPG